MNNIDGIKKMSEVELRKRREMTKKKIVKTKKNFMVEEDKFPTMQKANSFFIKAADYGKKIFSFRIVEIKAAIGKLAYVLLFAILGISAFYLSLFLVTTSYKIDNGLFRFLSKLLPIPALIVDNRFVDFYDYVDSKNKLNGDSAEAKKGLIKNVIVENFSHKLKANDIAALNKYAVSNEEINSASLNRIRKIRSLINSGGDFDQIAGKYGDRRESISLSDDDFAEYDYGDKIRELNVGDISNVISTEEGYYIFKCYEKDGSDTGLSYIFVKAKKFDEYVNEKSENIYYVSFVE